MTILVTGANGQLGREMRVIARGSDDRYLFADIVCPDDLDTFLLDITDIDAVRAVVKRFEVDVIVNCAAYTDVDKAETDRERCALLNTQAPENLAIVMKETGGLLVHISTDYVFAGNADRPYGEDAPCAPTSVYGRTKFDGETAIVKTGCRYIIIRTAWLYSEFGRNFVKTMLSLTVSRPKLNVVSDQKGTPTYALDLAEAIAAMLQAGLDGKEGIYHYSDEGVCTWYDFARMIAECAGHDGCEISPCTSEEFPSPVKRPSYSVLDKTKIKNTFGITIPHWADSLRKCLENFAD
jgi:dTDP-4-dehydrorhamnose reductase